MSEQSSLFEPFLKLRQPMQPIPTDVASRLRVLRSIRAVIFDVYGTLVISGSGDVGSADESKIDAPIREAMQAAGLSPSPDQIPLVEELQCEINRLNDARRNESCPKPEVDIVEAWRRVLEQRGTELGGMKATCVTELAAVYEARANPTWPMPGASETLERLRTAGMTMGIVSNAQVFTPSLVEDLLVDPSLGAGGFDLDLCLFSNRFRQAKPGPRLFDVLREGLARRGILPQQAIYVGNDMLNDVWAASVAGLKTAWFAGDARSCRPRDEDPRCRSLCPDLILTSVLELLDCLELGGISDAK